MIVRQVDFADVQLIAHDVRCWRNAHHLVYCHTIGRISDTRLRIHRLLHRSQHLAAVVCRSSVLQAGEK